MQSLIFSSETVDANLIKNPRPGLPADREIFRRRELLPDEKSLSIAENVADGGTMLFVRPRSSSFREKVRRGARESIVTCEKI